METVAKTVGNIIVQITLSHYFCVVLGVMFEDKAMYRQKKEMNNCQSDAICVEAEWLARSALCPKIGDSSAQKRVVVVAEGLGHSAPGPRVGIRGPAKLDF